MIRVSDLTVVFAPGTVLETQALCGIELALPDGDSTTACSRETSAVRPSPVSMSGRSPA